MAAPVRCTTLICLLHHHRRVGIMSHSSCLTATHTHTHTHTRTQHTYTHTYSNKHEHVQHAHAHDMPTYTGTYTSTHISTRTCTLVRPCATAHAFTRAGHPPGPHTMLMLHSALQCCALFLECIQHSVHSKSLALKCTRHSVHSTQWTLSTQCHSPYRHSVLSASIVCGPMCP